MDVVLELTDTFVADYIYAWLFPQGSNQTNDAPYPLSSHSAFDRIDWKYEPASALIHFEPSSAAYMSTFNRDNAYRQFIALFMLTWIFGLINYILFATISFFFIFDRSTLAHPKVMKNQVWREIKHATEAMSLMALLTAFFFLLEVRGYCKMYESTAQGPGLWYDILQIPLFILFTDFGIYWIHRGLHHPLIYKRFHKPHHKWIIPTPYASYAFHPLDGFSQSMPYHIYPLLFPLNKFIFLGMFISVNIWTVSIHDGNFLANNPLVNGSACHAAHHLYFNYNYGQFLTIWDRICGSYRRPDAEWFDKRQEPKERGMRAGKAEVPKLD
ncbi:fatty acid hydroxylase superfamily protein [Fusarium oxysporum f. sp. albedinis]|nr:fatty acid hydroxylase superfamily protein [Fusarium oxysporum f. sp. albedinis]KAJ0155443.1 hypothetical protein HZ326_2338 [Fusarium oxysporum f. sp. albedinis]